MESSSSDFADFRMFEKVKKIKKRKGVYLWEDLVGLAYQMFQEILRFWRHLNVSGRRILEYIKIYNFISAD